jgi:hypothetical protein
VIVTRVCGHAAVANSAAIALLTPAERAAGDAEHGLYTENHIAPFYARIPAPSESEMEDAALAKGVVRPDVTRPWMSDRELSYDLMLGYRRRILNNKDWTAQLNVRNLQNWGSDEVTITRRQPDGSPARARFDGLQRDWAALTYAMTNLNRSMGLNDAYPFVLAPQALAKLEFVHRTIGESRGASRTPQSMPAARTA